jgi:hypothetical protein
VRVIVVAPATRLWSDAMTDVLTTALAALIGAPCWSALAGRGAGGTVVLDLGGRLPRAQPLRNAQLTDEQRAYTGEHWLLVRCAWRLESAAGVVGGSGDPAGSAAAIACLVGRSVTAFEVRSAAHDLVLSFGDDHRLAIFCDRTVDGDDNYSVAIPGSIVEVGARGAITREERLASVPAGD